MTHDDAVDELRTYMMMLLVGAPVLIDAKAPRNFLEQAQAVGGIMAHALGVTASSSGPAAPDARLDDAVQRLRAASTPLLAVLDPETQAVVRGDESALPVRRWSHYAKVGDGQLLAPARLPPSLGCYGHVGVEGLGDFEEVERLQAGIREWLLRAARNGRHELRGTPAPAVLPLLCAAAFGPALTEAADLGGTAAVARVGVLSSVGASALGSVLAEAAGPGAVGAPVRRSVAW